jgi:hypothetical protein
MICMSIKELVDCVLIACNIRSVLKLLHYKYNTTMKRKGTLELLQSDIIYQERRGF